jgi:tetratricopeptide (TPR) repeat protein
VSKFWDVARTLKDRFDILTFLVTLFVSGLSGFILVRSYVTGEVEKMVSTRMAPYETFIAANTDFANGTFDQCVSKLRPVLKQFSNSEIAYVDRSPFYDLEIACIRESPNSQPYAADIKQIESKIAAGDIQTYSWHSFALGTYYLRSGQFDKSEALLRIAEGQFSAEMNKADEAHANWGMAILSLIKGQAKDAAVHYRRASQLLPDTYQPNPTRESVEARLDTIKMNYIVNAGRFSESVPAFIRLVARTSPVAPIT